MANNDQLNVTVEDYLNSRNIANAVTYSLMVEMQMPVRAIEMTSETDEKDFRFDKWNGKWTPFALGEAKARIFYPPPLVSVTKINRIWADCQVKQLAMIVALWFEDTPDRIHWRWVDQDYIDWAAKRTKLFGHRLRSQRLKEPGYPFPREHMSECFAHARRLKSPNSNR